MYSIKKNILQTVALLKAYGIQQIVLSPGSRNAPLIQSFSEDSFFICHTVLDERNAAFYALGIIQATQNPVVVCCTSGTALLNYAPAVAEAHYQQLPLIVLSADRAPEWINQMDGQTIHQPHIFGSMVNKSVQLPEIKDEQDEWYCNRILNEALIACSQPIPCPVHINIPISEPLFDYSENTLPQARKISFTKANKSVDTKLFIKKWNSSAKRMIIVGQMIKSPPLVELLEKLATKTNCVILSEHLSNCTSPYFINNFDAVLTKSTEDKKCLAPDILMTFGGHIVSKRIKQFIRENTPQEHWLLSADGKVIDLYKSLTDVVEADVDLFLEALLNSEEETKSNYFNTWMEASKHITEPSSNIEFSDIYATGRFMKKLPCNASLHLANSSVVRNAQLFSIHPSLEVYCNRGTNGIESSLPTAIGFAISTVEPTYLLIGDLSFFYSVGALWNISHIKNLRIVLVNNGGGGIFHLLPKLNESSSLEKHVSVQHTQDAKKWAEASSFKYLSASNKEELDKNIQLLTDPNINQSIILEIHTDMDVNKRMSKQ